MWINGPEENIPLTPEEHILLENFRRMSAEQKAAYKSIGNALAQQKKMSWQVDCHKTKPAEAGVNMRLIHTGERPISSSGEFIIYFNKSKRET